MFFIQYVLKSLNGTLPHPVRVWKSDYLKFDFRIWEDDIFYFLFFIFFLKMAMYSNVLNK